ncbi:hypothetical protein, partial [Prevotella sp.]|uniref:hypothetical protein n=1 Tax=Prevotella sp. TaxID=59823 RepID=UPI00402775D2
MRTNSPRRATASVREEDALSERKDIGKKIMAPLLVVIAWWRRRPRRRVMGSNNIVVFLTIQYYCLSL